MLASVRFRPPSRAWQQVELGRGWAVRFPKAAKQPNPGLSVWICKEGDLGFAAGCEKLASELKSGEAWAQSLAAELKGLLSSTKESYPDAVDERLPASLYPKAMGVRFRFTKRGKRREAYYLLLLTQTHRIRLQVEFDPDKEAHRRQAQVFMHQLRRVP